MSRDRQLVEDILLGVKVGQEIVIDKFQMESAYRFGFPSIYNSVEESFLSSMVGSSWGCWTCKRDINGNYIIGHHDEKPGMVYVDPDRSHLYKKSSSGFLVRAVRYV